MMPQLSGKARIIGRVKDASMRPSRMALGLVGNNRDNVRIGAHRMEAIRETCPSGLRKQVTEQENSAAA
jgi:hypothetical protein